MYLLCYIRGAFCLLPVLQVQFTLYRNRHLPAFNLVVPEIILGDENMRICFIRYSCAATAAHLRSAPLTLCSSILHIGHIRGK